MKKLIIVLGILLTTGLSSVFAQVVFTDNFNYAPAGTIITTASGNIWNLATGNANGLTVGTGLAFGSFNGSGQFNSLSSNAAGASNIVKRDFTAINDGDLYVAFLMNVSSSLVTSERQVIAFQNGTQGAQVIAKKVGADLTIGVRKNQTGTTTLAYSPEVYQFGVTYLVVLKTSIISGTGNDPSSLYVFETDAEIPSIEPVPVASYGDAGGTDATSINRLLVYNGFPGTIDAIRLTRTWSEAVSILQNRVASLSTGTVSSVESNTASVSALISSFGWTSGGQAGTITERGVAWNTTGSALKSENSSVSLQSTNSFSTTVTELPSGTQIFARAYADNAAGTAYGSDVSFFTLSDEPGQHSAGITAEVQTLSSVLVDWEENTGVSGYLILQKIGSAPTGTPVDGTVYTVGQSVGDATVAYIGSFEADTATVLTGLTPNTTYYYAVIPFNDNGSDEETTNYLTGESIPTVSVLTLLPGQSAESDLAEPVAFTYPQNIPFISSTGSDVTAGNSMVVWSLSLRDGGEDLMDSDANSTTLTGLTLDITNHAILQKLALYDGNTELAEVPVSGSTVSFSGFSLVAADDAAKTVDIRATFNAIQTDNQQFSLTVTNTTVAIDGSVLAVGNGGGAISSVTGDHNRIEVTATAIEITGQPAASTEFQTGETWAPAISARFEDANGNLDTDYSSLVSVSHNGSGSLSNASVSASAGVVSFASLSHDTPEVLSLSLNAPGVGSVGLNQLVMVSTRVQIFAEDMYDGSGTGTTNVTAWNQYDNYGVLTFGNGSGSPTLTNGTLATNFPSSGSTRHTGSGSYNVNLINGQGFSIGGINTSSYNSLRLSFGFLLSPNANFNGSNTFLEYSTDGSVWNQINWTAIIDAVAADEWYYAANVVLPSQASTANLRLRWRHTVISGAFIKIDDVKLMGSQVLANEPTIAATSGSVTSLGNTFMTLNWTSGNGQSRLVIMKEGAAVDGLPTDGMAFAASASFGNGDQIGSGNFVVYNGTGASVSVSDLTQGQTYHYQVLEYSGSSSSANYMSTGLTGLATTVNQAYAELSDVIAVGESESISISSLVNQDAPLSSSSGAPVWGFSIRDGGAGFEFDAYPTEVVGLVIKKGAGNTTGSWSSVLNAASLLEGTTHVADAEIGDSTLTFTFGSPLSIPDGGTRTYRLRVSLSETDLVDNQTLGFRLDPSMIQQNEPGSATSRFASFSEIQSGVGLNRIAVTATHLVIAQEPGTTVSGDTLKPYLTVGAVDANLNLDSDFNSEISVSSLNENLAAGSETTLSATSGSAIFENLVASAPDASVRLVVTSSGLQNDTTKTFVIRADEPGSPVTGLIADQVGNTSFRLQWNNPGSGSVLVTMRSGSGEIGFPVDGQTYLASSEFGEGDELSPSEFVVYSGSDTSVTMTGLAGGNTYYFYAYRFNGSGETTNYLGTAASGSQSTIETAYASMSDVVAVAESEALEISSMENAESIITKEDGVEVWSFRIRDGGEESFEFDSYDTEVIGLDIVAGEVNTVPDWSAAIQAAALFAGTEKVADAIVGESSLSFTFETPVVAPDGGHITLNLVLSLNPSGIADGQEFSFAIDQESIYQDEPGSATSRFTTFAAGSATGTNAIAVLATSIILVNQPDDVPVGDVLADLMIHAVDANGVIDTDINELSVEITANNNTLDSESPQTAEFLSGTATFSGLILTEENLETSFSFNAGEFSGINSDSFRVFEAGVIAPGSVLISQIHGNLDGEGTAFIELANPGTSWQDLRTVNLVIQDGSGNTIYSAAVGEILPPNAYWLISSSETLQNDRSGLVNADQIISIEVPESGQIALVTGDMIKLDGVAWGSVTVNNLGDGGLASGTPGEGWKRVAEGVDTDENSVDFESVAGVDLVIKNSQSGIFVEEVITLEDDIPVLTILSGTVGSSVTVTRQLNLTGSAVLNTESSISIENNQSWAIGNGNGWFTGEILRQVQSEANYRFPVGSETASFDVNLSISGLPESATMFYAYYRPTDPDVVGELPLGILDYYTGGFWTITTDGVNGTGSVSLTVDTENIQDYFLSEDRSDYVLLVRPDNESPWMIASETVTINGYLITAENFSQYGEFTIGFYDESTVPVELSSFELVKDGTSAMLKWTTRTENNNFGFHVEQAMMTSNGRGTWKTVDFVSGKGTTTTKTDYTWAIRETSSPALYRLRQVDLDGKETILNEILFEGLATQFAVIGNYPNPFNPTTLIRVSVPKESRVRLAIVNVLGQEVRTLIEDRMMPGITDVPFNASGLASGMYWAVFTADGQKKSMIRMVLLK